MASFYQAFLSHHIDLSPLGMDLKASGAPYPCTPKGATILGWAGVLMGSITVGSVAGVKPSLWWIPQTVKRMRCILWPEISRIFSALSFILKAQTP